MSKLTREIIFEKIKELDIAEGIVSSVVVKDGNVGVVIEAKNLTDQQKFSESIRRGIEAIPEVKKVNVIFTSEISGEKKVKNVPSPPTPKPIAGIKNVILVAAGKGGVGKSTVAVNLAVALAKNGNKVGIVDADIYGPSVAKMLSLKNEPEVENNQIVPPENFAIKAMSMGFLLGGDAPMIWRGPMVSKALQQLFMAARWGELDYLVIDMPPGTGDIHLTIAQNFSVKGAVIVTTPQEVALLDVKKCINMLRKVNIPILGIIENMSYFTDSSGNKSYIFGSPKGEALAKSIGSPYLGDIAIDPLISAAGDSGEPVAAGENTIAAQFLAIAAEIAEKL